jgi:hypothetical protein
MLTNTAQDVLGRGINLSPKTSTRTVRFASSIPAELFERQLQAFEGFQIPLRAINAQCTSAFQEIIEDANEETVQCPNTVQHHQGANQGPLADGLPSQVYTIFSGFKYTKRLITNVIDTVVKGLKDFCTVGDMILNPKDSNAHFLAQREAGFQAWVGGEAPYIVATAALGTEIDMSGITYVIHLEASHGLIDYVQEPRRAWRAGERVRAQIIIEDKGWPIPYVQPNLSPGIGLRTNHRLGIFGPGVLRSGYKKRYKNAS